MIYGKDNKMKLTDKILLSALLIFSAVQLAELVMVAYAVVRFFQWLGMPI